MQLTLLAGIWAVAAYAIYFIASKIVESRRHAGE